MTDHIGVDGRRHPPRTQKIIIGDSVDPDWQTRAACRGEDPGLFFGHDNERPRAKARRQSDALEICAKVCPVRRECIQHALAVPEAGGIWGIAEEELARELKRRASGRGNSVEALLMGAAA